MFIDNFNNEFNEFAEHHGYVVESVNKRIKKEANLKILALKLFVCGNQFSGCSHVIAVYVARSGMVMKTAEV